MPPPRPPNTLRCLACPHPIALHEPHVNVTVYGYDGGPGSGVTLVCHFHPTCYTNTRAPWMASWGDLTSNNPSNTEGSAD